MVSASKMFRSCRFDPDRLRTQAFGIIQLFRLFRLGRFVGESRADPGPVGGEVANMDYSPLSLKEEQEEQAEQAFSFKRLGCAGSVPACSALAAPAEGRRAGASTALPFGIGRYGRDTHTPEGIAMTATHPAPQNVGADALHGVAGLLNLRTPPLSDPDLGRAKGEPDFVNDGMPLGANLSRNSSKAGTGMSGPATTAMMTQSEISRSSGYTGDSCPDCGNFTMKRNGACLSCETCGATTGCS